jgi:UDP-N-acetylglucosamine acyltransferase
MRKLKLWLFKKGWINIHPDAIVHPTAFVHRTSIIYGGVKIGENVQIGPHCIIGGVCEYPNKRLRVCNNGPVFIEHHTILHGLNTVDGPNEFSTVIENDCTLMKGSHVGHDCFIQNNVTLSCGVKVGGFSRVEAYSTLGLNSTVHQKQTVPRGSMLGAGSFFKTDKGRHFKIWVGSPAKPIKPNQYLIDKLNASINSNTDIPKG